MTDAPQAQAPQIPWGPILNNLGVLVTVIGGLWTAGQYLTGKWNNVVEGQAVLARELGGLKTAIAGIGPQQDKARDDALKPLVDRVSSVEKNALDALTSATKAEAQVGDFKSNLDNIQRTVTAIQTTTISHDQLIKQTADDAGAVRSVVIPRK